MDRFNALGRGLQVMLVAGALLLIDTFLNWQEIETPIGDFGQSAWHGFGGVLLGILVIVLLAWIAARLAAIDIPLPVSQTLVAAALGLAIFVVALLKNLVDDYSSFWGYVGLILAALIAVGAWMQVQATGGMETLRSELPAMQTSSPPATTAQAPPPSEPAAPPPPPPPPPAAAPETPAETPSTAPPESERTGESTEEQR
jgi:hypothetical protein